MTTINVPRIKLINNASTLNKNKWRHLTENTYTQNSKNQLPWVSFFKEHTDILKIKLVTTVGYVKDDNNNWIPRFMKGFPLLLQGDMNSITNGNWEKDWNFFANTAFSTFMSGLPSTGEQPTGEPIPELMYKNMKEKKNLLILDLNTDRNDNGITQTHNFILHSKSGNDYVGDSTKIARYHHNNSAGTVNIGKLNNSERPNYLVVRIDSAREETTFNDNNNYGDSNDNSSFEEGQFKIFNYVYEGYVISPYDFLSRFTPDMLRGFTKDIIFENTKWFYVNSGITSPAVQLVDLDNSYIDKQNSHISFIAPFYYNLFLYPTELKYKEVTLSDSSNNSVDNTGDLKDDGRFSIMLSDTVALAKDLTTVENDANINYGIESLLWSSLSTPRHVEYTSGESKKIKYLPNYLHVNEITYPTVEGYNLESNNKDYMPIKNLSGPEGPFKACGSIIRNFTGGNMIGLNEINMPRKTITPYYVLNTSNGQHNTYAFNWSDETKNWNDVGGGVEGIDFNTNKINISNAEVIEYRNLVEINEGSGIDLNLSINSETAIGKKVITLISDGYNLTESNNKEWISDYSPNLIKLLNNSVVTVGEEGYNLRDILLGKGEEKFKISWGWPNESGIIKANSKKHAYVIDIASGKYIMPEDDLSYSFNDSTGIAGTKDPFWNNSSIPKNKLIIKANVFQVKVDKMLEGDNPSVITTADSRITFNPTIADGKPVGIYHVPRDIPLFGYLNFVGLRSSLYIGDGKNKRNACNTLLAGTLNELGVKDPYFTLQNGSTSGNSRFKPFRTAKINGSQVYFNPSSFYARTSFKFSNIHGKFGNEVYNNSSSIVFKNTVPTIDWRIRNIDSIGNNVLNTDGITISTTLSTVNSQTPFTLLPTSTQLYVTSLFGKFTREIRTFKNSDGTDNNSLNLSNGSYLNTIPPTIEINNNSKISIVEENESGEEVTNTLYLNAFQHDNISYVCSQKNLFIRDYWTWNPYVTDASQPPLEYSGEGTMIDRTLHNKYNIYDWKSNVTTDIVNNPYLIPNNIYNSPNVHNPKLAFENQCLIAFTIELTTILCSVSHLLVNTWSGNKIQGSNGPQFPCVGLGINSTSQSEENNGYPSINGSPTITILGGNDVSPPISGDPSIPVYFSISSREILNFATTNTISQQINSKVPSEVPEYDGNLKVIPSEKFTLYGNLGDEEDVFGGWFSYPPNDPSISNTNRTGIFRDKDGNVSNYETINFSSNVLARNPTNIQTTIQGKFTNETQSFPIELLFAYPFDLPDDLKPDNIVSTYINSPGDENLENTQNVKFDQFKGNKRFSSMYSIKITGSNETYSNDNFSLNKGGTAFPRQIIVNCVELPPPKQINDRDDMLSKDNTSIKILWKGYNFDYSPNNNPRDVKGTVGNIVWKITRLQTQLETEVTLFEGVMHPEIPTNGTINDAYNLSVYKFTDTSIRIYDKYVYTITGTYEYKFKRTFIDDDIYTLRLPFGSFKTPELIVCKNNKFEYGRYNTTSTNLKLFRPLLLNREGGQKDHNNKQSAGGICAGNIFSGSTRISSSQNIYANTSNQLTKKEIFVLLSKQQFRPFR